jgi:hypothetical protein
MLVCINHGCNKFCIPSGVSKKGIVKYRVHCSHCQGASYGRHPHREGVTPFKQGKCSNINGKLGFNCPTDFNKFPEWAKGLTEVDHIDGNNANHSHDNLQELCVYCHKLKGQMNGDYKRKK